MSTRVNAPITIRLKNALHGVKSVYSSPIAWVVTLLLSILIGNILIWVLNVELAGYILFSSPLNLPDKLSFFVQVYIDILADYKSQYTLSLILFSLSFATNLYLLFYLFIKIRKRKLPLASSTGFVLAVGASGCVACGTSIIAPVIATIFGAGASAANATPILNYLATAVTIYSIITLGGIIQNTRNDLTL